ncbi:MAG TPA: winged helix-turn-helix domain-containing protein [Nitrososphaera sp.]
MGKYRSRTEIVYQILATAKEIDGVNKTRIMFKSYLSFAQLKEYLKLLIDSELLEYDPEGNTYRTTDKGVKMLEACRAINHLVQSGAPADKQRNS